MKNYPFKDHPKIDMTGIRVGRLLVTSFNSIHPKSRKALWNCICDCGNSCVVQQDLLKNARTRSCGCIKKEFYETRKKAPGIAAKNIVYRSYIQNARKRGVEFRLEFDEFIEMTQEPCVYCGREPYAVVQPRSGNGSFAYNGIDRRDPRIGYVAGNCVPCCQKCNEAKMDLTVEQFADWVERVSARITLWRR